MEFLKAIFGDKSLTLAEFEQAVNAHNGAEANKENQIKLANLGGGEYVGKGKYDALSEQLTGKQTELDTANQLIEQLKKDTKGNAELQGKITGYEAQVSELQKQLLETKINSALKVALLGEKALDVDYLTFKIKENLTAQGKALELDDAGNIKGFDTLVSGLKTQYPAQFEAASSGKKVLGDNKLPSGDPSPVSITAEQFRQMGYNDRLKLKQENEQLFYSLAKTNTN